MDHKARAGMLLLFIAILVITSGITGMFLSQTYKLSEQAYENTHLVEGQGNVFTILEVAGSDGREQNLSNFSITLRTAPGSLPLKFDDVSVAVASQGINTTVYEYAGTSATSQADSNTTHYSVDYLQQGVQYLPGVIHQDDLVKIYVQTPRGIVGNRKITFRFIPKSTTETTKMVLVPEIMNQKIVQLYPSI